MADRNGRHFSVLAAFGASVDRERVIAVGLLAQKDLNVLGPSFKRAWPLEDVSCFSALMQAIDEAERELRRAQHQEGGRSASDLHKED